MCRSAQWQMLLTHTSQLHQHHLLPQQYNSTWIATGKLLRVFSRVKMKEWLRRLLTISSCSLQLTSSLKRQVSVFSYYRYLVTSTFLFYHEQTRADRCVSTVSTASNTQCFVAYFCIFTILYIEPDLVAQHGAHWVWHVSTGLGSIPIARSSFPRCGWLFVYEIV